MRISWVPGQRDLSVARCEFWKRIVWGGSLRRSSGSPVYFRHLVDTTIDAVLRSAQRLDVYRSLLQVGLRERTAVVRRQVFLSFLPGNPEKAHLSPQIGAGNQEKCPLLLGTPEPGIPRKWHLSAFLRHFLDTRFVKHHRMRVLAAQR